MLASFFQSLYSEEESTERGVKVSCLGEQLGIQCFQHPKEKIIERQQSCFSHLYVVNDRFKTQFYCKQRVYICYWYEMIPSLLTSDRVFGPETVHKCQRKVFASAPIY